MILNSAEDCNYETPDLYVENLQSKKIEVPVVNNTEDRIKIRRGTRLVDVSEVEESTIEDYQSIASSLAVKQSTPVVKETIKLSEENRNKLERIILNYREAVKGNKKVIPFEHTIELTNDTPVSLQPRRLPYGLREPVKEEIVNLYLLILS